MEDSITDTSSTSYEVDEDRDGRAPQDFGRPQEHRVEVRRVAVVLLALSDEGAPAYDHENAAALDWHVRERLHRRRVHRDADRLEPREKSGYVNPNDVEFTDDPFMVVAKRDILYHDNKLYNAGDTFEIFPENRYYEIQLTGNRGKEHILYPRIQDNPTMGMAASPDIKRDVTKDLYAHVVDLNDPEKAEWSEMEEVKVGANQEFFANDYVAALEKV